MICPNCKSEKCQFVSETSNNGFSMGNGCCGMLLLGPFGLLCGLCGMGGATNTYWKCNACANQFQDNEGLQVSKIGQIEVDNTEIKEKYGEILETYRGFFANKRDSDVYLTPNLNYDVIDRINKGLKNNGKESIPYSEFIATYGKKTSSFRTFFALTKLGLIRLLSEDGMLIVEVINYEDFALMPTYESGWVDRKIHFDYTKEGIIHNIVLELNTTAEIDKNFYDVLTKVYFKNVKN